MILIRRSLLLLLVICVGCVAQSASPDLARKIERQVRSHYNVPPEVHLLVGALSPSAEFPNYDALTVTIDARPIDSDVEEPASCFGKSRELSS